MVCVGFAPCARTIKIIEFGTLAFSLFEQTTSHLAIHVVAFYHARDTIFIVGCEKDIDATRIVAQNIVGNAADENTTMRVGSLENGVALKAKESLFRDRIVVVFARSNHRNDRTEGMSEETFLFIVFLENVFAVATFFCRYSKDFFIIVVHVELLSQKMSDGAAASSELSPDSDDKWFHKLLVIS